MREPYRDPKWRAVRARVLERDRRVCQVQAKGCKGYANHVHHLVDWRDGGEPFAERNLVASCASCNIGERNRRVAKRARQARGEYDVPKEYW